MQFHRFLCYYQPMLYLTKMTVICKIFVIFLRKYFVRSHFIFMCSEKKTLLSLVLPLVIGHTFYFHFAESCNLFHGEWVPHLSGPAYTNASCRFIESPQNCDKWKAWHWLSLLEMEAIWLWHTTVWQQGVFGWHAGEALGTYWWFNPSQSRAIIALSCF